MAIKQGWIDLFKWTLFSLNLKIDPSVYHIQFNSTVKSCPIDPTGSYMECIDGVTGNGNQNYWQIMSNGKLNIGGTIYTIETLTSTSLSYYYGSLTTNGAVKYIFHKI